MKKVNKYFISGLVTLAPLAITLYSFIFLINFADDLLGKYLRPYFNENFGFYFKGLSIFIGLLIIFFIGFLVTNILGQRIYQFFENLMIKLPFFRQVYPALKEMAMAIFSQDRKRSFKKVVLIEYPRKGIYSFGFLTNTSNEFITQYVKEDDLSNIFVPTSPSPLTGFTIVIPTKEVILTDIPIESAFRFIISGGVVNP